MNLPRELNKYLNNLSFFPQKRTFNNIIKKEWVFIITTSKAKSLDKKGLG